MRNKRNILSGFPAFQSAAFFMLLLILLSCEKTIHMDIKDERRRIVVNSFISTDQPVQVSISRSQHILDNASIHYITDAKAYLYKNENLIDTFIHTQDGFYTIPGYYPETGATYKIMVSATDLVDVEAINYIPVVIPIISIDTATVMYSGSGGDLGGVGESREMLRCKIKFQDPSGQQNFYQLQLISSSGGPEGYAIYFETDDSSVENFAGQYGAFFNDELFDGKSHELNIYTENLFPGNTVYFMLFSVTKDYSMYFRTLSTYQQNSGGPFSEPVMVYNNIKNGLGIFAGYSLYVDTLYIGRK